MRVLAAMGVALLLSLSGFAQTTTTTTATAVYEEGNTLLDSSGNLFVVDSGRSTTGVTITGSRHSFFMPMTRITVIPKGGSATTVEYNGSIQVIGVGSAVYAIATSYTVSGTTLTTATSLIAIRASLPAGPALTGFASQTLTSPVDARTGPADLISVISQASGSSRTAAVWQFTGTAFLQVSSGTLP